MANTEDMRYIRTEEAIRSAFMDLVANSPVTSVTASALCRQAHISRNAFYLHHSSIATLYHTLVEEIVDDVRIESIASAKRLLASGDVDTSLPRAIMSVFAKHEQLLRALLPADDGSLAKQLAEGLEGAYVEAAILLDQRGASFEHRMNCAFASWAHIGLVTRWIAETDRPLVEALPIFESMQAGLSESTTRFLTI